MNELSTVSTTQTNLAAPSSLFDSMAAFNDAYKIAEVLCQTQLIPSNFQRKPADVLVALDYSRRLGVPPTAILPHLYVINGRPAMSAQMLIGLVNRSGVFSRIQWEEKVDGVVEWSRDGVKQSRPNIAARAYFTELSTGEKFYSPWIDLKLALSSGWLTKSGSKWLEMPTIMARYRSASVLIKSVCPELALGMEFADELADEEPQRAVGGVKTVTLTADDVSYSEGDDDVEPSEAAKLILEINESKSVEELASVGDKIAEAAFLSERELEKLRKTYTARRKELVEAAKKVKEASVEATTEVAPEAKPAAKKTRARKTTAEPATAEVVEEVVDERKDRSVELLQEGIQQIAECDNVKLLTVNAVESIQRSVDEGSLLPEHAEILRARIKERVDEIQREAQV